MANINPTIRTKKNDWSNEQIDQLKNLFPNTHNAEISKLIKKSVGSIRSKANTLQLKKSLRYWEPKEETWLLKNYPTYGIIELMDLLKEKFKKERTKWSIINKYRELKGLR